MTEIDTPSMEFCSFHTHTGQGSYGDGFAPVSVHVDRVADLGMGALGIAEHGNPSTHVKLEQECRRRGIKPIYGIEAYFGPTSETKKSQAKTHLTIFAMNQEGYRNLNRLVTQSYRDEYYKPTVSWESLVKHNAGLVVLSGCADSLASCTLLGGKFLGPRRDIDDFRDQYEQSGLEHTRAKNLRRVLLRFADVFDEGRFFLECQRFPGLDRTRAINATFADLSQDTGIPLIATADVHYPFPDQNIMQRALHAAHRDGTVATLDAEWEWDILLTYPTSDSEIINDLIETGLSLEQATAAVHETTSLARLCTVELPKAKPLRFPGVPTEGIDKLHNEVVPLAHRQAAKTYMWQQIRQGWRYRVGQRPDLASRAKEYNQRLQYEMKIIADKDFCDYFLIYADLVSYVKDRGAAVGPARGSAAGSLVAYLLRLTETDPLYPVFSKMIFERFIDPTREDMPDIDLDFDTKTRTLLEARAVELYGRDNVANVANEMKYRGKSALAAMAKAHMLGFNTFKPIADRIEDRTETDEHRDDSILGIIDTYADNNAEVGDLVEKYWWTTKTRVIGREPILDENDDPRLDYNKQTGLLEPLYEETVEEYSEPGPLQLATWLEGDNKGLGVHAAGFVIADPSSPISETCAILTRKSGTGRKQRKITVIPYDKRDAEYLNMIKLDWLGLNTIGVVQQAAQLAGLTMEDMYRIYPPDGDLREHEESRPLIERFLSDDLVGIFQFEGGTTRSVLSRVEPTEFRHLADINALSRPGPKYGGQTERYINVKSGDTELESIHPLYDQHVDWSYGQIVYQEQIMFILRDLAGFPIEKVLKVRKIIGKKLGEHQFATLWEDFKRGCENNNVNEETALRVWRSITTAAGYAFNTSHSYSYSLVAWWQMWLKINHPAAFYAATLAANGDGKDERPRRTAVIVDAMQHGLAILPFDPALCQQNWIAEGNSGIRPGFLQMPNVGEATADDTIAWRDKKFRGDDRRDEGIGWVADGTVIWRDLLAVKGIGVKTVGVLEKFANLPDPFELFRVSDQLVKFRNQVEAGNFDNTPLPSEGEYALSISLPDHDHCAWVGFVSAIKYNDEVEIQRRKTGRPAAEIREELSDNHLTTKATLFSYDDAGEMVLRVNRWRLPEIQPVIDKISKDHHVVVAWGKVYEANSKSMQVKAMWILDPD